MDGFTLIGIILAAAVGLFFGLYFSKAKMQKAAATLEQATAKHEADQGQIMTLLTDMGQKDVLIERSTLLLESGSAKMQEMARVLEVLNQDRELLKGKVEFQQAQYDKLLSQKKSSETRLGFVAEQMAPFLADYPLPAETGKFLGQPIDILHFLDDKIVFVEIKSGKSQLSKKQREIRDQIKEGKVEFMIYRIDGDTDGPDTGTV